MPDRKRDASRQRCNRCCAGRQLWPGVARRLRAAFVGPDVTADDGIRTRDLRFTKPLLYQLSYVGTKRAKHCIQRRCTQALLQRQDKCLADFTQRNALRSLAQGGFEAFDWFSHWLEAESEGLMMNRHDEARACVVCHFNCLLGRAMRADPRVVSADGHNCDIDGPVSAQFCETVRHCSI